MSVLSLPVKAAAEATVTTQTEGGIEVTRLTIPYKFFASIIVHLPLAMRKIRRLHRPIVHVHGTGLFQASLLALLRLKRIPRRLDPARHHREGGLRPIASIGRLPISSLPPDRLVDGSLRISPVLIFDTPYVLAEVPPTGNDVHVIPQGIFTEEFAGLPREPREPPPLVLSLGVLSLRQRAPSNAGSLRPGQAEVPAARLVIAGTVTDPNYHRHLPGPRHELGLGDSVDILVDLPRHEIVALLGRGHVFALHSQEESKESPCAKRWLPACPSSQPALAASPTSSRRESGILVPYGEVPGFAEAIIELLSDPTPPCPVWPDTRGLRPHALTGTPSPARWSGSTPMPMIPAAAARPRWKTRSRTMSAPAGRSTPLTSATGVLPARTIPVHDHRQCPEPPDPPVPENRHEPAR